MTSTNKSKALNISLWIAQVLLALMFLMAGAMKSAQPVEELAKSMSWVNDFSAGMVRFIGASELLGGIGLLLPSLLRIRPLLTPLAALGLFIVMVFAFIYHVSKGEYELLPVNSILGTIALFIVWGRYKKVPIQPKA
ncbi:MAG: DoxX family protein [Cyclobacteriaceae bacterium]|jgi:putative oxidoreductase|nr:DoxX family protein [Cyclobacteriaceae bacterium]MBX2914749.1 DoxX family protein [Cyclobacteriaceae bacterium]QLH33770.1 MAG: DoxX family protein [Cyclobacteriaceae bacterium]